MSKEKILIVEDEEAILMLLQDGVGGRRGGDQGRRNDVEDLGKVLGMGVVVLIGLGHRSAAVSGRRNRVGSCRGCPGRGNRLGTPCCQNRLNGLRPDDRTVRRCRLPSNPADRPGW